MFHLFGTTSTGWEKDTQSIKFCNVVPCSVLEDEQHCEVRKYLIRPFITRMVKPLD